MLSPAVRKSWLVLATLAILSVFGGTSSSAAVVTAAGSLDCGTTQKFGHEFRVLARGKKIRNRTLDCSDVARITAGRCKVRFGRVWSCFSYRPEDGPFVAWWPSREAFHGDYSTTIIYRRYPCRKARVTPERFTTYERGFPTQRQLLADDIVRCGLLLGSPRESIENLVGPADSLGSASVTYRLGPERGSLFQVDDEILRIGWNGHGIVDSVGMYQG